MPSVTMRSPALTAVLASLAMLWGPGAQAQSPHPMTVADLPLLKGVTDPQISPDGRSVAYVRTTSDYQADKITSVIVIVDATSGAIRHMTSGTAPLWSPDGRLLALRDDAGSHAGIWIYDVGTEQRRFLVPVYSTNAWLGNLAVKNYAWSPDGSAIAYVGTDSVVPATPRPDGDAPAAADVEVFSRIMYKTRIGFTDNRRTHIYVMPVACGAAPSCVPRVLTPGSYDEHSLAWSPDGHHIAFVSDRSPDPDNAYTNDLWTVDAETGQVTRLTDTPSAEFWPAWSPDGKQIAFPAWRRTHNTKDSPAEDTHVWAMSAAGGAAWPVAPSLDRRVGQVSWSPAGGSVYFTATDHGSISVYRAPAAGGPAQRLTTCTCQVPQYSLDHAGRWMAYVQNDLTHPSELWIAGADGRGARQLSHEQDSLLARVTMVPSESFAFTSFDGLPVQAWLIKPAGLQPGQRYPLILSIHGGPHSIFGNSFTSGNQILAAHGYGILAINPRGTNGYGQAFSDGSLLNWGGGDYHDLMAGLDTVISHNPWIDTTRMGLTGGSYGGFMTNWIITQTPRFRAAVSLYSVSNLISFYGTSLYTDLIESEFNGLPWDNYPLLWQWSPLAHVAQARTPTLFLHGEVDNDVPVSQAEEMYVALRKQGVAATFALYPGEGHGFHRPAHILDSLLRLEAWFDHYLGSGGGTNAAGGSK
jgi:dipeptidyl aminopeptidase/acylaminoacyl peptidase